MRIRWSQPYNEKIERYRICIDSGLMTNDYDYDDCYHLHFSKDEYAEDDQDDDGKVVVAHPHEHGLMTNDYDYDDCYHLHISKDE